MNNNITLLVKYAGDFGVKDEIAFINEKFQEYTNFLGDHSQDTEFLHKAQLDLKRPLDLIDTKVNEIMLQLYM